MLIQSIVKDQLSLPPPDAKPEFLNVRACIMKIDPDQTPFFYTADAATGKKVCSQDSIRSAKYFVVDMLASRQKSAPLEKGILC